MKPISDNTDNVEITVYNWLMDHADGWPVSGDIPAGKERPSKFIIYDRTGGGRQSMVLDQAEILVEVYDQNSRYDASQKAQELADNVQDMLQYENVTHVDANSLVHLDDPQNGYHRYQLYINVYQRR